MQFLIFHLVIDQIVLRLSGMSRSICLQFVFVADDVNVFSALIYCCIDKIQHLLQRPVRWGMYLAGLFAGISGTVTAMSHSARAELNAFGRYFEHIQLESS